MSNSTALLLEDLRANFISTKENIMKAVFITAFLVTSVSAGPSAALAADEHDTHHSGAQVAQASTHTGHGTVNMVDAAGGKANITHGPIKSLKWPAMTMDFRVDDSALLKDLKPGMEVDFELAKKEGGYRIVKIGPASR